jgi:hypothetical protein
VANKPYSNKQSCLQHSLPIASSASRILYAFDADRNSVLQEASTDSKVNVTLMLGKVEVLYYIDQSGSFFPLGQK